MKQTIKFFRYALMATVAALGLISCAEREEIDMTEKEQISLDAWVAKHVNNKGERAVRQENGLWVEISDYGDTESMATNDTITWVKYNFTMRDMTGNVIFSRYEDIAKWQGTFTKYTHYVPDYIFCGDYAANLLKGTHYMMRNTLTDHDGTKFNMHIGTKGTIYIPSTLAYGATGTSNDAGYGGQFSLSGGVPSIIEFEIVDITKDPVKSEEEAVDKFVAETGNWKPVNDTLDYLYVDKRFRLPEGETAYQGDSIGIDSTVHIWYVGKFLDGFVFDTNIDSIKRRVFGEVLSEGTALEFTVPNMNEAQNEEETSYINAWNYTIPHLLQGQWARIVATSFYCYGSTGQYRNGSATTTNSSDYYYMNMYNNYYSSYYNNMYGYGGYGGYGGIGGYDDYYSYYMYQEMMNYQNNYTESESTTTITTEIQSYTPLYFEIYIEK